ncbi:MAG: urate hydroxylase PuuD [Gammaproteobacteria bacterium]|nr:urate hydroxylase PuuD [Gammaproteobacteria bacterium]
MNPLNSLAGTLAAGVAAAVLVMAVLGKGVFNPWSLAVWLHVLCGIVWVGLLYYFNLVQVPAVAAASADGEGPGPAAINRYVAPRALFWFRWGAVATWLTGAAALETMGTGLASAFTLQDGVQVIGLGAWLGTIMLLNVWLLIWPSQRKLLGLVPATDAEKVRARQLALTASRINTLLSLPMLMCMVGQGHGLPY